MNGLREAITIIECWNTINLTKVIQPMKLKYVCYCMRLGFAVNSLPNILITHYEQFKSFT